MTFEQKLADLERAFVHMEERLARLELVVQALETVVAAGDAAWLKEGASTATETASAGR